MHVAIITVGTRGDVQPYVCLAAGLLSRGHRVTLCTHLEHYSLVYSLLSPDNIIVKEKFHFVGFPGNPHDGFKRTQRVKGNSFLQDTVSLVIELQNLWVDETLQILRNLHSRFYACQQALPEEKMVFAANLTGWCLTLPVAEALSSPCFMVPYLPPEFSCNEFSNVVYAPRPLPFGWLNVLVNELSIARTIKELKCGDAISSFRKEVGLPEMTLAEQFQRSQMCPHLLAYSATLSPTPPTWKNTYNVSECGGLVDAELKPFSPPLTNDQTEEMTRIQRFINAAADRPIFFGWGSMIFADDKERMVDLIVKTVEMTGLRAIVQSGWANLCTKHKGAFLGDRIYQIRANVPHSWLFPQCSVIVHHGGSGTTHTALHSGTPQVITPVLADQPFWAYRVSTLGVGPNHTISAYDITPNALAEKIMEATGERCRLRAAEIGRLVQEKENGVVSAAYEMERFCLSNTSSFWSDIDRTIMLRQSKGYSSLMFTVTVILCFLLFLALTFF